MSKSFVYQEVLNFVESKGCSLITPFEEFKNKSETISIKSKCCDEGIIKTRFNDFLKRKYYCCKNCIKEWQRKEIYGAFKLFVEIDSNSGCVLISSLENYKNSTSKLLLRCHCGNEFSTTSSMFTHSNKRQCNDCGYINRGQATKIPYVEVEEYLLKFNCRLLTSFENYKNASQKLDIECSCGNPFENTFSLFKYGKTRRCNECYRKELSERKTIPYFDIKDYVENISESNCKIITPEDEYINSRLNIDFQCGCGELFKTSFHEFKSGGKRQCNECGKGLLKVADFINIFSNQEEVEHCKLIEFESQEGYIHARHILTLQCQCGEYFQTPRYHFLRNKKKCDICSSSISMGELRIKKFLDSENIVHEREYSFSDCRGIRKPLPFDFVLMQSNEVHTIIEYDGRQHFNPSNFGGCSDESAMLSFQDLKRNDQIKNEYCEKNNIKLIRIPYWDFDNIEEILIKELF
ncbi:hypothetical protein P4V41_07220 [Fictibacillus nanhaiensis]|uniref:hypothetical protein n=1 Tax=Fictibacillus nanhaiensis TaxID=742169 RepID=UPI002E1B28CE|nr:hypothetical protein [Fictibacillus nanhaiensis]